LKLSKDGWSGLAIVAASLLLFALTLELKPNPLVPIGPGFYPRIVLGITAGLAAILVAMDLFSGARMPLAKANYGPVVLHFALFGLYAAALPWIGFRLATAAYVLVANALIQRPRTPLQWLRPPAVGIATALACYLVFERYLSVLLPRGRWTDF
jgi:putative tricarboxylic transport membrane protein